MLKRTAIFGWLRIILSDRSRANPIGKIIITTICTVNELHPVAPVAQR